MDIPLHIILMQSMPYYPHGRITSHYPNSAIYHYYSGFCLWPFMGLSYTANNNYSNYLCCKCFCVLSLFQHKTEISSSQSNCNCKWNVMQMATIWIYGFTVALKKSTTPNMYLWTNIRNGEILISLFPIYHNLP